jgi:hypothetical protein
MWDESEFVLRELRRLIQGIRALNRNGVSSAGDGSLSIAFQLNLAIGS